MAKIEYLEAEIKRTREQLAHRAELKHKLNLHIADRNQAVRQFSTAKKRGRSIAEKLRSMPSAEDLSKILDGLLEQLRIERGITIDDRAAQLRSSRNQDRDKGLERE